MARRKQVSLTLVRKGHLEERIERTCTLERVTDKDGCALRFDEKMSEKELEQYAILPSPEYSLRLARQDYSQVFAEIEHIKSCRSNIFIGTMAAMAAATVTTATIIYRSLPPGGISFAAIAPQIIFGTIVALVLLTVGILATLEKARALNMRRAFLAALGEYLKVGQAPRGYRGWPDLASRKTQCGNLRKTGWCARIQKHNRTQEHDRTQKSAPPPPCWNLGKKDSDILLKEKRIMPGMLDSFMSLSGFLYTAIYGIVGFVAILSMNQLIISNWEANQYIWIACVFGAVFGAFTQVPYLLCNTEKKEKRTRWAFKIFASLCGIALISLFWINITLSEPNPHIGFGVAFLVSLFIGWLGRYLIAQLQKVRKGLLSFEALHRSWRRVLRECHPSPPKENEHS